MSTQHPAPPIRERKTYFISLFAENIRLQAEIINLKGKNRELRAAMKDADAAGNQEPLNQKLAAANINLVKKLRGVLSGWEQGPASSFHERRNREEEVRQLQDRLAVAEKKADELEQVNQQQRKLLETVGDGGSLAPAVRIRQYMDMKGELEGLYDLLISLEQERSIMIGEQVRKDFEIHLLNKRLAACPAPGFGEYVDDHSLSAADNNLSHQKLWEAIPCTAGYESLVSVLCAALEQASGGKGLERHAVAGEPFDRQKICEITRRVGFGYPLGQAIKKAEESVRLGEERGRAEILGAINYLAAAHICMSERVQCEPGISQEVAP